jgi:hypothetical protein
MRRYSRSYSSTPAYTLPSGRQATSREYRERMALLKARETCEDCKKAADAAVFSMETGISQCSAHRSYGR